MRNAACRDDLAGDPSGKKIGMLTLLRSSGKITWLTEYSECMLRHLEEASQNVINYLSSGKKSGKEEKTPSSTNTSGFKTEAGAGTGVF